MAQAAAKIETQDNIETTEKPVEVVPERVTINTEGFVWRDISVRMPEGSIGDDLRNPKIWRRVQANGNVRLLKYDHLFILAHDESWFANAIVTYASNTSVMLAITRISSFREESATLYNDGMYQVFWSGHGGYGINRMSDGIMMGNQTFTTEGLAIQAIRDLYPKKAF